MRNRSNLVILFGIAFFLIGGVIVFLLVDGNSPGVDECQYRGGIAVQSAEADEIVCINPSVLR